MKNWRLLPLLALLTLLGIGLARYYQNPEPHSVTLTWHAPAARAGVTVVGYNVYRRVAEDGSFVKIADRVPGPPYVDRKVNSGRTYSYVVTAVDQAGRESRFSAEIKAEVP